VDAAAVLREADTLHQDRQFAAAAAAYRRALTADPNSLQAWYGLGCACASQYAYGDAIQALRHVVTQRPDAAGARCTLAQSLFELGHADAAVAEYRLAAESGDPEARTVALAAIACIAPGCPSLDDRAIRSVRADWAASVSGGVHPLPPAGPRAPGKLRVGYVSAYFGARNWMKPVWGVINRHDRDRFEIHLLSDGRDPSAESGYADHPEDRIWQSANLSNADLARRVREAGLDVLVDLNGYSRQGRLRLFLYRPAPRQITWFNMYASSGLSCFDALVSDASVVLPGEEAAYSEPIVRVTGTYLAFDVLYPVPAVAPPPVLRTGWVTFGCFASAHKITDGVVAAWARILLGAPGTRLLLRNQTLHEASNRVAMMARFAVQGVAPDRLTLSGGAEHFEFLRGYEAIDVALDTFPYNGGTTTTEALWQGVPVLAFTGDRWSGRTSRSLLLAAGLPQWVAANEQDYVAKAIAVGRDAGTPALLADMRRDMRARLRESAACDCATLCNALEELYLGRAPPP
jgi:predicted O-linked N-acetylglucosamine transferase (SPINDLY family)